MNYTLNGISFQELGLVPARSNDSNLAISGCWDMPSRIGKTFHDWGDENGIEPYLREDEIFFGGRDISVSVVMNTGENRTSYVSLVQSLYDFLDLHTDELITFSCPLGSWKVQLIDAVSSSYLNAGYGNMVLKFREPVVAIPNYTPSLKSGGVGIDGYSFNDLGLVKTKTNGQAERPSMKQTQVTAYSNEMIGRVKRNQRDFSIDFFIDSADLNTTVGVLHKLLASPGSKMLRLDDGTSREVFVKDGFSVSEVRKQGEMYTARLKVNFTEIKVLETWNKLTDSTGLILTDKHGQLLTEIVKGF